MLHTAREHSEGGAAEHLSLALSAFAMLVLVLGGTSTNRYFVTSLLWVDFPDDREQIKPMS
jgi:hypothetical protein